MDRVRLSVWQVHWMDRDKLINEVGGNMNVAHLVREWMPAGNGTRWPTTVGPMWSDSARLHKFQCPNRRASRSSVAHHDVDAGTARLALLLKPGQRRSQGASPATPGQDHACSAAQAGTHR
jgi:hypothetical protein